jgi:deazaflavin-dependent oxidoreductase (nitroreductase family)
MTQPDYVTRTIAAFRANNGQVGDSSILLLHNTGARSGEARLTPMMYLADGPRYLVFASKQGADTNPAWYYNLRANPDARIEVGDQILDVHAVELAGAERDRFYAEQKSRQPRFAEYEEKTTRVIHVIALTPTTR